MKVLGMSMKVDGKRFTRDHLVRLLAWCTLRQIMLNKLLLRSSGKHASNFLCEDCGVVVMKV